MGLLVAILLAVSIFTILVHMRVGKGGALQLCAAMLLVGIAGYALQGTPDLPGRPTPPAIETRQPDSAFALERTRFLERFGSDAQVLDAADAMHRAGLEAYGVGLIRGGLQRHPNSPDLWLGMGNALTLYAGGTITPAAKLAFERAAAIAPDHPGPPYFLGFAHAQAGQLDQARAIWRGLLARTPPQAPWRPMIEARLAQLDRIAGD